MSIFLPRFASIPAHSKPSSKPPHPLNRETILIFFESYVGAKVTTSFLVCNSFSTSNENTSFRGTDNQTEKLYVKTSNLDMTAKVPIMFVYGAASNNHSYSLKLAHFSSKTHS